MPTTTTALEQFLDSIHKSDATYSQKQAMYDLFSEYVDELLKGLKDD